MYYITKRDGASYYASHCRRYSHLIWNIEHTAIVAQKGQKGIRICVLYTIVVLRHVTGYERTIWVCRHPYTVQPFLAFNVSFSAADLYCT